jgi:hypothetical protein
VQKYDVPATLREIHEAMAERWRPENAAAAAR